ncbi:MAG: hypothetical protein KDH15_20375 [Rhodocyclaceae bacterium]|nr:hypothetical protein [Rhodocyclaceae bacterium]
MEYAQARMQARLGRRPGDALWRRLSATRSLAGVLATARDGGLAAWLDGVNEGGTVHTFELAMRANWRREVARTARWMPAPWRAAVSATAALIDLPAWSWLAAGRPAQPWMHDDPALERGANSDAAAPLTTVHAWDARWRACWPPGDDDAEALARFAQRLGACLGAALSRPADGLQARSRPVERFSLQCFRRLSGQPAAAFPYLCLVAIDLRRLQACLVLRTLALESSP